MVCSCREMWKQSYFTVINIKRKLQYSVNNPKNSSFGHFKFISKDIEKNTVLDINYLF